MVKNAQADIMVQAVRQTRFRNLRLEKVGIEVMRLSQLRCRIEPECLARPERIEFHMLLLVTSGNGQHTVDFEEYPLQPGTLIAVRPGQVQCWHPKEELEGLLILFEPSALLPGNGRLDAAGARLLRIDEWPVCVQCPPLAEAELTNEISHLSKELDGFDQSDLAAALIRQLTGCVLLRVARVLANHPALIGNAGHPTFRLFIEELERTLTQRPTVRQLAHRLGYSASTLNRLCIAARGVLAKDIIDHRVALEAARLLIHSSEPSAQIGMRLGFTEATNFSKFFQRIMGHTPKAFRRMRLESALSDKSAKD